MDELVGNVFVLCGVLMKSGKGLEYSCESVGVRRRREFVEPLSGLVEPLGGSSLKDQVVELSVFSPLQQQFIHHMYSRR